MKRKLLLAALGFVALLSAQTVINGVYRFVSYIELTEIAAPSMPGSGLGRLYLDSSSGDLGCVDDAGGDCLPSGGGGGITVTTSPIPTWDEFMNSSVAFEGAPWGALGWLLNSSSGTCTDARVASTAGHPGIINFATTTGTADGCFLYPQFGNYTAGSVLPADDILGVFVTRWNDGALTTAEYGFGLRSGTPSDSPATALVINKDAAETDWQGSCRSSGETEAGSGAALAAVGTGWVVGQIRRVDASTIGFKVASTISGLAGATEQTCTANIPTGTLFPIIYILKASGATVVDVDVDFFWFQDATAR